MPDNTDTTSQTASNEQNTSDATDQNTAANTTGTATDAAQQTPAQSTEKTFTQADVDRIVQNRLKSAVKAELKKLTGDDDKPDVNALQTQLSEQQAKIRSYEAKDEVQKFLADGRNKLNIKPENHRGIEALVIPLLEYDDDGKPSNLKEAIESAKSIAPVLFTNGTPNINGHEGRAPINVSDMNGLIRRGAGIG